MTVRVSGDVVGRLTGCGDGFVGRRGGMKRTKRCCCLLDEEGRSRNKMGRGGLMLLSRIVSRQGKGK